MRAVISTRKFTKDMNNLIKYSAGFMEGVKRGRPQFMNNLGLTTIEALKAYIDSNARVNPQLLHHMYEWNQTGSPESRLFNIKHKASGLGLSFNSGFRQSTSVKPGSRVPFYNKAKIMEEGVAVTIKPKGSVLAFNDNGEEVFTRLPVRVENPGGNVQGEYERVFESFFSQYFSQAFLRSSGIWFYLKNPIAFKQNIGAGFKLGTAKGIEIGQRWISSAGGLK